MKKQFGRLTEEHIFAPAFEKSNGDDSVAQLVEHYTFNVGVLGSNPSGITE